MDISIIIPVYNAEKCIKQLVEETQSVLNNSSILFEIILVDDGSKDSSWSEIEHLKKLHPEVIIGIKLSKNFGQHNATLCGMHHSSAKTIVTMDDDGEHNPEDILKLYKTLNNSNCDLVYGVRNNSNKSLTRKSLTSLYKKVSKVDNKNAGIGSSFRIFKEELKDQLINHQGPLFFIDELVLWYTNIIESVTLTFRPSQKSNSGYSYSKLFGISFRVLTLSSTIPLKMVRLIGIYISVFSLLLGIYFLVRKFIFNVPVGYTSMMVAILFSTGIITACLGIIGEYLGNLIALINKKPSYSVHKKI
jgi:glycosyltransferase involved in cell wall biosynthesis